MLKHSLIVISGLMATLVAPLAVTAADLHPEVKAALQYEVPENTCKKPRGSEDVKSVAAPTQSSGSLNVFDGSNTGDVSEIDSYTRKRLARKEKRWKQCVGQYKEGLLADMERLKSSAQHGLTQEQANTILANMARVQEAYMTTQG